MNSFVRFTNFPNSKFLHKCLYGQHVLFSNRIIPIYQINIFGKSNNTIFKNALFVQSNRNFFTNQHNFNQTDYKSQEFLNLEQYFDQVKLKLTNKEINHQRPSNLKFVEYENLFAYNAMKNTRDYHQTVYKVIQKVSANDNLKWPADLTKFLFETGPNEQMNTLIEQLQTMSTLDVVQFQKYLLSVIPFSGNEINWDRLYLNSNFCKIWKTLDTVSSSLLEKSPLDQSLYEMLAISSLWFELGLDKHVVFNRILIRKLLNYNRDLDKVSLLHLMFSLNVNRSIDSHYRNSVFSTVASFLNKNEDINLDELSIIAMGFFKTQTKMPNSLLTKFIDLCVEDFSKDSCEMKSTISVASILKLIRFSLETTEFDARVLRNEIKTMVDLICTQKYLLDSNICLTHLILLLNSAYLQNCKKLYKTIFDRMISNLEGFRIKDIERILFCLANVLFICPNSKLKTLEEYLMKSEESQIYPYHVYNISYYLLILNFYPHKLLELCCNKDFLTKSIESFKMTLNDTLLITDTILRLEMKNQNILTLGQISEYNKSQITDLIIDSNTKKGRFVKSIGTILSEHYASNFRFMYIFSFSKYPFPIILSNQLTKKVGNTPNKNLFEEAHPYTHEYIKPNYFRKSVAILPLLNKDKTYGPNIRGFAHINKRLLEKLGFQVVKLEQRDYPDFILPVNLQTTNSDSYHKLVDSLLKIVDSTRKTL